MNDSVSNPFGLAETNGGRPQSAGALQLQARENTEVLALIASAKRFPRDVLKCCDKILNAFTRVTLAEKAQYQYARGGTDITGPSIRAAEAIAQQWGNMSSGWREVSRSKGADGIGVSEIEAYCVDYESTGRESIQFVVRHWRDTKSGGYALKDERDIYELCANQAARRKRACILAQIPGDVTEMAMEQVAVTLRTSADTSPEGIAKLVATFETLGITKAQIEKRIQRKVEAIQPAQVVHLKRVYASLRDDMSEPGEWFEVEPDAPEAAGLQAVRDAAAAKRAKKDKPPVVTETTVKEAKATRTKTASAPANAPAPASASPAPAPTPTGDEVSAMPSAPASTEEWLSDSDMRSRHGWIARAKTQEDALIVVDEVRDATSKAQIDELMAAVNKRWPADGGVREGTNRTTGGTIGQP